MLVLDASVELDDVVEVVELAPEDVGVEYELEEVEVVAAVVEAEVEEAVPVDATLVPFDVVVPVVVEENATVVEDVVIEVDAEIEDVVDDESLLFAHLTTSSIPTPSATARTTSIPTMIAILSRTCGHVLTGRKGVSSHSNSSRFVEGDDGLGWG